MNKYYTLVGSRETPKDICDLLTSIASKLKKDGWIMRSGHAQGADRAGELGAQEQSVIYIPWLTFGQKPYKEDEGMPVLGKLVCERNTWLKNFEYLKQLGIRTDNPAEAVKLLHGRNVAQIQGLSGDIISSFVIFYAKVNDEGKVQGGTATAVELAQREKIPTFNLWIEKDKEKLLKWVS